MTRTTISLPDELDALLRDEARRRGTSVSEVVRALVAQGLLGSETQRKEIPWAGITADASLPRARDMEARLSEGWADAIDRDRG